MTNISISQLWVYPIKSMKGISLESVQLEKRGFLHDRRWMLVDKNKQFMSQRQYPQMSQVEVSFETELGGFGLSVRAPNMPMLIIPYADPQMGIFEEITVTCWQDEIIAQVVNSAINNWFSECLQVDCQLVYMPESTERAIDKNYTLPNKAMNMTSFADGFPNLLISEASLEDLNSRVDIELSMSRFRPNIVISGCAAYHEDQLAQFQINDINFYAVKPCSRCIITTIDPITGKKQNKEPLKTLATFRKKDNQVFFGQNCLHQFTHITNNNLKVGDKVTTINLVEAMIFDHS
jgi:uncharacterized protein YcbX